MSKTEMETMMNYQEIYDFFPSGVKQEDENLEWARYDALAEVIIYYWTRSFKEQYPERQFKVEYGQGLEDDRCDFITVYEIV